MKALTDTIIAYKLVWIRVALYFVMPFVITFLSLTETWSGQTWDETHPFLKTRLFISCCASGLTSFVAYLDSSMARASNAAQQMKEKREATEVFTKPPTQ